MPQLYDDMQDLAERVGVDEALRFYYEAPESTTIRDVHGRKVELRWAPTGEAVVHDLVDHVSRGRTERETNFLWG